MKQIIITIIYRFITLIDKSIIIKKNGWNIVTIEIYGGFGT